MAPPPVDRNGEPMTGGDTPRSLPTPFLTKTYQLVDDHNINDVISWNEDGSTFIVWNPTEFAKDLLPKYFKHNNFSSFVRQLNTYGFRKVVPDRWEFSNECFKRGERKLLCDIQRRKVAQQLTQSAAAAAAATAAVSPAPTPVTTAPAVHMVNAAARTVSASDSGEEQVLSSSNSPAAVLDISGGSAELIGENERLRRENMQLNKELSHMKSLCNNICALMSNYANNNNNGESKVNCSDQAAVQPLDLLPLKRFCKESHFCATGSGAVAGEENAEGMTAEAEEISARLFGVPIGVKRGRESEGRTADHAMDLQLQQPGTDVKSEPLDQQSSGDDQESGWSRQGNARNGRACS